MKKTIIALFALASVAIGNTTISPIMDSDGTSGTWAYHGSTLNEEKVNGVKQRCDDYTSIYIGNHTIQTYKTNWQVDTAIYTLHHSLEYSPTDVLSFSFDATNNGQGDNIITLALVGSEKAIVIGHGNYKKIGEVEGKGGYVQVGVTDNVTATGGYGFATTNPEDDVTLAITETNNWAGAMPNDGATTTLSGQIAWDGDSYALTLNSSAKDNSFSYDLGLTTLDITKLVVTLEGGGALRGETPSYEWAMGAVSNLSVSTPSVPEPATATLSLLALAGLAARRRRK